jgi:branched-chain amino acid transport system substrate-binding protein
VFRCSFTQAAAMPKVARYLKDSVKAKTVAVVYVNNDFGKGGRDAIVKDLDAADQSSRRHLDGSGQGRLLGARPES